MKIDTYDVKLLEDFYFRIFKKLPTAMIIEADIPKLIAIIEKALNNVEGTLLRHRFSIGVPATTVALLMELNVPHEREYAIIASALLSLEPYYGEIKSLFTPEHAGQKNKAKKSKQ